MTEDWTTEPVPELPRAQGYAIQEQATGVFAKAYFTNFSHNITHVRSYRSSLSYVTGSHALKAGFTLQEGNNHSPNWHGPLASNPGQLNDMSLSYLNSNPVQVTVYTTPYTDYENLDHDLGLYAQDAWRMGRLTLNLAARLDFMKNSVPRRSACRHLGAGPSLRCGGQCPRTGRTSGPGSAPTSTCSATARPP